jgi:hypothetical protein
MMRGTFQLFAGAGVALSLAVAPAAAQTVTSTYVPVSTVVEEGFQWTVTGIEEVESLATWSPGGMAVADGAISQGIVNSQVVERANDQSATIVDSGIGNAGMVNINQETGALNNQANLVGVAVVEGGAPAQLSMIYGAMTLTGNAVTTGGAREARIAGSFGTTAGIVTVNQAAGNMNQQLNALAILMSMSAGPDIVVVSDAALGLVGTQADNALVESAPGPKLAEVTQSFAGFQGLAMVNQAAGEMNRMGAMFTVSVSVMNVP